MGLESHKIHITGWTKEQIFEKVKEIFDSFDSIIFIKVDATILEYEVLNKNAIPKNPSLRERR